VSEWSDPPRLFESELLSDDVRRQLTSYGSETPGHERRGRMFARIESELGLTPAASHVGGGATDAGPTLGGALGATAARSALLKFKLLFSTVAVVAGSLGLYGVMSTQPSQPRATAPRPTAARGAGNDIPETFRAVQAQLMPQSASVLEPALDDERAPSLVPRAQPMPVAVVVPTRSERSPRAVRRATTAVAQPRAVRHVDDTRSLPTMGGADPVAELTLLARARRVMLSEPSRSLELAEQHAREYPAGALNEEREVLAIESLLKLARRAEAAERARAFERHFPDSAHRAHLARIFVAPVE